MEYSEIKSNCSAKNWVPALEEKVAFLCDPRAYDGSVGQVELHETNMSWLFLADGIVLKLKKPVRFPYLDFSTREKRGVACRAEVELDRRLAADVYLDAVPLCVSPAGFSIGEGAQVVDWLVKMRRLDQEQMLDRLLAEKRLGRDIIEALASKLAAFYRNARAVLIRPDVFLKHRAEDLRRSAVILLNPRFGLSPGSIRYLDRLLREFLVRKEALFVERLERRRIVDGHGDLRPEHIWLGGEIKIIDCLEFNARLRALDPLEEIAYLDLECEHLGAKGIGDIVRRRVSQALRDRPPLSLFHFYRCYRAILRARLSVSHLLASNRARPKNGVRKHCRI
jgi:uncharacterized protein